MFPRLFSFIIDMHIFPLQQKNNIYVYYYFWYGINLKFLPSSLRNANTSFLPVKIVLQ